MTESLPTLLLATAYAPPVSYFVKLYEHVAGTIALEGCEHYIKQSYRNRCRILGPNGVQSLTIPVELPAGTKTPIREVRISDHGEWRHLHAQALRTAYGASPFFEFYADELMPFYERRYTYLWDFNAELLQTLLAQLQLDLDWSTTTDFLPPQSSEAMSECCDLRYTLSPKQAAPLPGVQLRPYYQLHLERMGFVEDLSILDLLFEMGPEALLVLRDSLQA